MLMGTLNPTHSLTHSNFGVLYLCLRRLTQYDQIRTNASRGLSATAVFLVDRFFFCT